MAPVLPLVSVRDGVRPRLGIGEPRYGPTDGSSRGRARRACGEAKHRRSRAGSPSVRIVTMARAGRPIIAVMGAAEPVIAVAAPCRAIVAIANAAAPLVATAKAGRPVIAVVGAAEPVVAVATPCRAIGGIALARAALSTWRI